MAKGVFDAERRRLGELLDECKQVWGNSLPEEVENDIVRLLEVAEAASDPKVLEALRYYEGECQSLADARDGDDDAANARHAEVSAARYRLRASLHDLEEHPDDG